MKKVKLSLCLIKHYAMKAYGGSRCIHPYFLDLGARCEWLASRLSHFIPDERTPGIHWIGGWLGPIAGLEDVRQRKILHLPRLEL
jgi:hypothetical protein